MSQFTFRTSEESDRLLHGEQVTSYSMKRPSVRDFWELFAIHEFQDMKMQPSLERVLRHRELLKA